MTASQSADLAKARTALRAQLHSKRARPRHSFDDRRPCEQRCARDPRPHSANNVAGLASSPETLAVVTAP
jgi:hypothetical protein